MCTLSKRPTLMASSTTLVSRFRAPFPTFSLTCNFHSHELARTRWRGHNLQILIARYIMSLVAFLAFSDISYPRYRAPSKLYGISKNSEGVALVSSLLIVCHRACHRDTRSVDCRLLSRLSTLGPTIHFQPCY
ncbi:hypothetical protein BOTBODRAFT_297552 [Botryobasidium botryosum FD-172 SS1]|uniref:Uncharacterized protein n=1 Tax=Botryobasidium botryosum (strain FD-172 SS1) TaxID=930990 RepID=A0A067MUQ1_BOTB1|nr:hypothetical protein BOTBODRAFT_297552 [Botryobasidium botryosum FD-172 SS1]